MSLAENVISIVDTALVVFTVVRPWQNSNIEIQHGVFGSKSI